MLGAGNRIAVGELNGRNVAYGYDNDYSSDNEKYFEQTKSWVRQNVPVMKEFLAEEGEAQANSKTPEGARYQASIEKSYKEMMRDCVHSDGGEVHQWDGEFETLIRVGTNGSVETSV